MNCFLLDPLPGQGTQRVELRSGSGTYLLLRQAIDDLGHLVLTAGGRHGKPAAPLPHPAGDRRHTLRTGPSQPAQRHSPKPTTSPEAACGQRGGARPPTPTQMALSRGVWGRDGAPQLSPRKCQNPLSLLRCPPNKRPATQIHISSPALPLRSLSLHVLPCNLGIRWGPAPRTESRHSVRYRL